MSEEMNHPRGCRCCGTMALHRRLLDEDPGYARRRARIEEHAFRAMRGTMAQRPGCTRIPVVVHVVYKTDAQNISREQIDSQIEILNQDFRKTNADISSVPAPFAPLAADARLLFVLATTDPDGNATDGITRTQTEVSGFSGDDKVKADATGGKDGWPSDEYLNIWVCPLSGGLLGYAQFPGGPAATDGVVVTYTAFGNMGTAQAPFNLGRTATHEIGHWLNLFHIWGDDGTGCSGSDFVDDTPNQGGANVGKPSFPKVSCDNGPNGDMFMNYMDYVDDDTMVMFTEGQVARMQACLDGPRSAIGETVSCTPVLPKFPSKDSPKELTKEIVKELAKDPIKDPAKETGKELPKDRPKEVIKDFPKEGPKDGGKELLKDGIKEPPKELSKEKPKELPKDLAKDKPKDLAKDPGVDPGKIKPLDPPKQVYEAPGKALLEGGKQAFENPQPGGWGSVPVQPAMPVQLGTPLQPFVLATGQPPAGASLKPPTSDGADNGQALLAEYAQMLAYYAQLHQMGMLDQQGMMAWQQAWEAYLQLGGQ
ncbi:hypothetical protein LCL99_07040 [Halomonas denitrificans]|uniref:zinc metalloprotease n=1 Tax=Halomonas denitrificans TaxID=370769 RepID=UPI001CD5E871|nr:zinc metalloprotease [Halomonas denitrificans]MCA0974220.1 hypothetical protein [Halomonas denitrificans]